VYLEVISMLSSNEVTESLLAFDRLRGRKVVIERTLAHEDVWNPVTDESLERSRTGSPSAGVLRCFIWH
jgi:hypothetical protein